MEDAGDLHGTLAGGPNVFAGRQQQQQRQYIDGDIDDDACVLQIRREDR
jgi:hypothetical protein